MTTLLASLASLLVVLSGLLGFSQTPAPTVLSLATTTLTIGETKIAVEIADTNTARAKGLSGRTMLDENRGMLFVFNRADYHTFWMKEMLFPLDIIWLDDTWRVIDLTQNISPKSFPNTYQPRAPARYVLEVNAGFIATNRINIGDQSNFAPYPLVLNKSPSVSIPN